jgi:hypothetical protein
VETAFVRRPTFWAGAWDLDEAGRIAAMHAARAEYVENLVASDYVLCTRGNGNYSYRLYETLSVGRIPVFVDTDSVLPFGDRVDWRSLCVWIDEHELAAIGRRVAEHYAAHSDDDFVALQRECRRVWEEWIEPSGFFRRLAEEV